MENPIDPDWPRAVRLFEAHSAVNNRLLRVEIRCWQGVSNYAKRSWLDYAKAYPDVTPEQYAQWYSTELQWSTLCT